MFRSSTIAAPASLRPAAVRPAGAGLVRSAGALFATVWTWSFRTRSRRCLAQLDERLMRDIGLDPVEWRREVDKPFWKA
jgi:uncharacterized protein YjiS (DUF1127 family)